MNIQKEREAFQECYKTSRDYKFYVRHEMSDREIFEFKRGKYVVACVNWCWEMWQAAKSNERRSLQSLLDEFKEQNNE